MKIEPVQIGFHPRLKCKSHLNIRLIKGQRKPCCPQNATKTNPFRRFISMYVCTRYIQLNPIILSPAAYANTTCLITIEPTTDTNQTIV